MKKKIVAVAALIIIICALALVLSACNNVRSIESRLLKEGYEVDGDYLGGKVLDLDEDVAIEGLMWYLSAGKESAEGDGEYVQVYSFDKNSQAKSAFDYFEANFKGSEGYTVKKSGNIVAVGTVNAVKTAL